MSRLDRYLFEKSLVPSRAKAQEIIQSGGVEVFLGNHFQVMRRPSFKVDEFAPPPVRLLQTDLLKYVARSGLKIEYAIKKLGLDPQRQASLRYWLIYGGVCPLPIRIWGYGYCRCGRGKKGSFTHV